MWELKGVHAGSVELVAAEAMDRSLFQTTMGWVIYVYNKDGLDTISPQEEICPALQALCKEYAMVFDEPKGLPPKRSHDHQIPQLHGAGPGNLRPYGTLENRRMSLRR